MRIDPASALSEAARRYKAERPAIHAIAGLFFFVPGLAFLFFAVDAPAVSADVPLGEALQVMLHANWPGLLAVQLLELFGSAWLLSWLLGPDRPSLAEALPRAARLYAFVVIASILTGMVVFAGLLLFLAPGFYAIGRTLLVAPVLIAEPGTSPMKAFERSFALTRGQGWMLFVVAAAIWLTGQFPNLLLRPLEAPLGEAGAILINAVAAFAGAAVTLFLLLVKIAVYRATVSKQGM